MVVTVVVACGGGVGVGVVVLAVAGGGVGVGVGVGVVVTLTRITESVVIGQAPVLWGGRIPQGKKTNKPKVIHAYFIADAMHASARKI